MLNTITRDRIFHAFRDAARKAGVHVPCFGFEAIALVALQELLKIGKINPNLSVGGTCIWLEELVEVNRRPELPY